MKKVILFLSFLTVFNINTEAQQIDLYNFQQFDLLFPNNRLGFGLNFNYSFKNNSKLRFGYSYQKINKQYPVSDFGYYFVVTPNQNLNDFNIAYIFNNPKIRRLKLYYGIEASLLLIRGSIKENLEDFNVPVNFEKFYFGNELILQYSNFLMPDFSLTATFSYGIIPTGISLADYYFLAYYIAPVFRIGVGISYNFRNLNKKKQK